MPRKPKNLYKMTVDNRPKRTPQQREADLVTVAKLYTRGLSHQEITDYINNGRPADEQVSRPTISHDIGEILERWRSQLKGELDQFQARELAKIDMLEREYWDAWERSKRDLETRTIKAQQIDGKVIPIPSEPIMLNFTKRDGNAQFLAGVQQCIDNRCKILGLYAPNKVDVTSNGKAMTVFAGVPDEHIDKLLTEAINGKSLDISAAVSSAESSGSKEPVSGAETREAEADSEE